MIPDMTLYCILLQQQSRSSCCFITINDWGRLAVMQFLFRNKRANTWTQLWRNSSFKKEPAPTIDHDTSHAPILRASTSLNNAENCGAHCKRLVKECLQVCGREARLFGFSSGSVLQCVAFWIGVGEDRLQVGKEQLQVCAKGCGNGVVNGDSICRYVPVSDQKACTYVILCWAASLITILL